MASSPDNAVASSAARDPQSRFRQSLKDLDDRLKRGEPFSGHERNCLFLNTGAARWATVSHVSGFDFDDDARALAATDWDGDGDVDVWIANRTAPMVRYLRNDTPRAGDSVSLQLTQDTGNRHAIGARVEIKIRWGEAAAEPTLLIREVRAGDSYLSQSSLRLHFGLGPKAQIAEVSVRWPGGARETFAGVQPNAAWLLRMGAGKAEPLPARQPIAKLPAGPVTLPPGEIPGAVPLAHSIPLPRIDFTDLSGQPHRLDEWKGAPIFLTLVSGEHKDCAAQFAAWQPRLEELKKAGIRLCAAGMDDTKETRALLTSLPAGIERGFLTANARERLAEIYNLPFEIELALSAPAGFTLDQNLRLLTLYRGAATVDQLLTDVQRAAFKPEELSASALPFTGTWFRAPTPWAPLELMAMLVRQNDLNAAHTYVMENRAEFVQSRRFAAILRVMADLLTNANRPGDAVPYYRNCLKENAADAVFLNNFAHCLLHQPGADAAAVSTAVIHAAEAVKLTSSKDAALLDTLAHALQAAGRKAEAAAAAREGLALPSVAPAVVRSLEARIRETTP